MNNIEFKISYGFHIVNGVEDFCQLLNDFNKKNSINQIIDWKIFDKTEDKKYIIVYKIAYKKSKNVESFYF